MCRYSYVLGAGVPPAQRTPHLPVDSSTDFFQTLTSASSTPSHNARFMAFIWYCNHYYWAMKEFHFTEAWNTKRLISHDFQESDVHVLSTWPVSFYRNKYSYVLCCLCVRRRCHENSYSDRVFCQGKLRHFCLNLKMPMYVAIAKETPLNEYTDVMRVCLRQVVGRCHTAGSLMDGGDAGIQC